MFSKIKKIPGALVRRVLILKERMHGLDFTQALDVEEMNLTRDVAKLYAPTLRHDLIKVLTDLDIQPGDAMLDYGSGKGAAIVIMSEFKFNYIGGVELSGPLVEICKKNLSKLNIKNWEVFNCDAQKFKDLDRYTHFYIFNPFPGNVLEGVVNNIAESCERNPRKVTLIYYCPRHRDVIDNHPYYELSGGFQGKHWEMLIYSNVTK